MSETSEQKQARGVRNTRIGVVHSNKMAKSVIVRVERMEPHPLYKRYVRRSAKFMAHDEANQCKVGDTVEISESRPLSARKRWRVKRVVSTSIENE